VDKVNSVQELIERTAHMPLEKMRFFINEDRREPRCFGIYHDEALDRWVVYKNKGDGSRAVRYSGPDEAYAANELWMKLQSEIALRRPQKKGAPMPRAMKAVVIATVAVFVCLAGWLIWQNLHSPSRGYYYVDDQWYYYQNDWYWYDDGGWMIYDAPEGEWWEDGYYGETNAEFTNSGQGFEQSGYYEEPDSDSAVFDSWDAGDTDWSSDW